AYQLADAGIGTDGGEDLGAKQQLGEQRLYQAGRLVKGLAAPEGLNPRECLLADGLGDRWVTADGSRHLLWRKGLVEQELYKTSSLAFDEPLRGEGRGVPDLYSPIPTGRSEAVAIGAERHARDPVGVTFEGKGFLPGGRVPDLDGLILTRRSEAA